MTKMNWKTIGIVVGLVALVLAAIHIGLHFQGFVEMIKKMHGG